MKRAKWSLWQWKRIIFNFFYNKDDISYLLIKRQLIWWRSCFSPSSSPSDQDIRGAVVSPPTGASPGGDWASGRRPPPSRRQPRSPAGAIPPQPATPAGRSGGGRWVLCPLAPGGGHENDILTISVGDPDPGSGAFLTPGSGMGRKSGSRSGMNNPDHISESLETIFWVKILKFFDADPEYWINTHLPQCYLLKYAFRRMTKFGSWHLRYF